jgi:hypothetical protein
MSNELILLVPEAPAPKSEKVEMRERKGPLETVRLGTLGNSKANADPLLQFMVQTVHGEVPLRSVVALNKSNASVAASNRNPGAAGEPRAISSSARWRIEVLHVVECPRHVRVA